VPIFPGEEQLYCGMCSEAAPIGQGCSPLPAAGVTATWDGRAAAGGTSTCLGDTTCLTTAYRPAGDYVVTMCTGCPDVPEDAATKCVSIPFAYPTTSEIVGTL
jgi:hypothetical protein